jgi:hypothetical protein
MLHRLQLISNEFQRGAAAPRDMKRDMATFAPPAIAGLQTQGVAGDGDPALTKPIENA